MDRQSGFLTHYLVSGPNLSPFENEQTDRNQIRYEQYLRSILADKLEHAPVAAGSIKLGSDSALGQPWEYLYPCSGFVNFNLFSFTLQKVDLFAASTLSVEEELVVQANVWTYTALDIWLNDEKVCSASTPVYKPMMKQEITLPLRKGSNTLLIVMQNLAVRDTRNIFGIQLLEQLDKITAGVPDAAAAQPFIELEQWLSKLALSGNELMLPSNPPCSTYITYSSAVYGHDPLVRDITGLSSVALDETKLEVTVYGEIGGKKLSRQIELLHHHTAAFRTGASHEDVKTAMFEELTKLGAGGSYEPLRFGLFYVMARWNLGKTAEHDHRHISRAIEQIERREDCSDFHLAGLLRLMEQHQLPASLEERAEQAILNYRYWMTEDGSDGMCFWSENHALMFYICAYMAGSRYPERHFIRSGRTGKQVKEVALGRIREWLTDVEGWGYEEFQSTDYMCVTLGALLNAVDYMEPAESDRASALIDVIFEYFACHAFRGSIITPQARIYRSVILPFTQAAQSLMHLINPDAPVGNSEWIAFLMNSRYELPYQYIELMNKQLDLEYATGNAWIKLYKQQHYMLTSVQSPRSDAEPRYWRNISFDENVDIESHEYVKSFNERFHGTSRFEPGVYGYQQHMWYAALDNDTVLYTNHPGELADEVGMRPGYWYGNGIMPAVKQQGNELGAIYAVSEEHPVAFTHVFFPEAKLDSFKHEGQWLFAEKIGGYAAIWCSEELQPHHDKLFHCEYRAYGRLTAYYCKLGSIEEFASFQQFQEHCRQLAPMFDAGELQLAAATGYQLQYVHSDNKTQYV